MSAILRIRTAEEQIRCCDEMLRRYADGLADMHVRACQEEVIWVMVDKWLDIRLEAMGERDERLHA